MIAKISKRLGDVNSAHQRTRHDKGRTAVPSHPAFKHILGTGYSWEGEPSGSVRGKGAGRLRSRTGFGEERCRGVLGLPYTVWSPQAGGVCRRLLPELVQTGSLSRGGNRRHRQGSVGSCGILMTDRHRTGVARRRSCRGKTFGISSWLWTYRLVDARLESGRQMGGVGQFGRDD